MTPNAPLPEAGGTAAGGGCHRAGGDGAGDDVWILMWHRDAVTEREAIRDPRERVALMHVCEKLRATGARLPFPHQSAVRGAQGHGLRELRPQAGRSPWRALYRRVDRAAFVVLAVGPEASKDPRGFRSAIDRATRRFEAGGR